MKSSSGLNKVIQDCRFKIQDWGGQFVQEPVGKKEENIMEKILGDYLSSIELGDVQQPERGDLRCPIP